MNEGRTATETAPSQLRADEPTLARYVGGIGWGIVVVGLVAIIARRSAPGPGFVSEGMGWLFVLIGVTMALIHAAVESDLLLRRVLGGVGAALVLVGVGWGIAMAFKGRSWAQGLIPALPGLFLIGLYVRKEEDEAIRHPALIGVGWLGLLLCLVGVVGSAIAPQWMPARFSVPMVLGLVLVLMYLGFSRSTDEIAYWTAVALGAIGAVTLVGTLQRAMRPTILYEWRNPPDNEHLIAVAAGLSLVLVGLLAIFVLGKPAEATEPTDPGRNIRKWGRIGAFAGGFLILMGIARYFASDILVNAGWGSEPPRPYLVPTGFVLLSVGLIYGLVAIGYTSENHLVVLTRRELSAYFVSPIAYAVIFGFVLIAAQAYRSFVLNILFASERQQPLEEPIVQIYVISFMQVVALMVAVSVLTMRLFSEEKRTGTLEVLLTAPVNDWPIVLSKFFAAWVFFMVMWLPWWLYLLAMRLEGGQEFDFRPMIAFAVALIACGASFMAMGMFFSSLTRDQIISAVLTFMGMTFLVGFFFLQRELRDTDSVNIAIKSITRPMSFIHTWLEATEGKLYVRDIIVQLSMAIFWLFGTVKVLEARRWN